MSLQNLELPPFAVTELYKDFLVNVSTGEQYATLPVLSAEVIEPVTINRPIKTPEKPVAEQPEKPAAAPAEKPMATQSAPRIKFLGGNKKRIAFIVDCKTDVYLPDKHLDWLGKMLEACRLNLGDVAIANVAKNAFTIADIRQELQSTIVILLGAGTQSIQLPLNFPHFNPQRYDDIMFLNTPSPDELNQNTGEARLLKSKLWVSLQKLFKL
jgi:hypothetical protein